MHSEIRTEDRNFQEEVNDFLYENLGHEFREAGRRTTGICSPHEASVAWQKILNAKGWAAPHWPVEFGGTGWSPLWRHIFATACHLAHAPLLEPLGLDMVGPAIMGYGTEVQKAFYLPRILAAEDTWCQGYSEPGSGSDLSSLQTRATVNGDDYVINGTKVWTTFAHHADRMFCLVRTSTDGKPQEGISFVLLKMDSPGIIIKPIINMSGNHEVNQVFFDNLRVPQANRVGAENNGWTVAKYLLEFERGGRGWGARLRGNFAILKELAQARGLDKGAFSQRLAGLEMDIQSVETTEQRVTIELQTTGRIGPASSLLKLCAGNALQAITECSLEAIGVYAAPYQQAVRDWGSNMDTIGSNDELTVVASYLDQRARSIAGGSNEVQRNIMAKRILGM